MRPTMLMVLLLAGCATQEKSTQSESSTTTARTQAAQTPATRPRKVQPELGMSKEEIRAGFGKPKHVTISDRGEVWQYNNHEMIWIPFNFGYTPKQHIFVFGTDGKLTEFTLGDF